MKVGDLVSCQERVGILVDLVSDDPIVCTKWWLVQWSNGARETLRERFLEVVNEGR